MDEELMLSNVFSAAIIGLHVRRVTVEVDIASRSLPSFTLVGLADKAVDESRERVRSAIRNSGADFPGHRLTVNLAPADLPKAGPSYDLPIALGILAASGQLPPMPKDALFIGELSLDGTLRHINGVLPVVSFARSAGFRKIFLPQQDAQEASAVSGIDVYPAESLVSVFRHIAGSEPITVKAHVPFETGADAPDPETTDLADICGQEHAKRAFEIAAAGGHNILLEGPPGAGKTMLARSLPSIMPAMTEAEAIEVTNIYSITGNLSPDRPIMRTRPFRSPHHTVSRIGLVGGGPKPMPGEISLAHRGALFLDEFPEFPRSVLESLRQPMEDGVITVSRAAGSITYPAKFILVAAANPCPCGNYGSETKPCTCAPGAVERYRKRVSGPLLDRIDLHCPVPPVSTQALHEASPAESSRDVRARVQSARGRALKRFAGTPLSSNAELTSKSVRQFCVLAAEARQLLDRAADRFSLSARSYYRTLKVARTIADLAGDTVIGQHQVAEALQYREISAL